MRFTLLQHHFSSTTHRLFTYAQSKQYVNLHLNGSVLQIPVLSHIQRSSRDQSYSNDLIRFAPAFANELRICEAKIQSAKGINIAKDSANTQKERIELVTEASLSMLKAMNLINFAGSSNKKSLLIAGLNISARQLIFLLTKIPREIRQKNDIIQALSLGLIETFTGDNLSHLFQVNNPTEFYQGLQLKKALHAGLLGNNAGALNFLVNQNLLWKENLEDLSSTQLVNLLKQWTNINALRVLRVQDISETTTLHRMAMVEKRLVMTVNSFSNPEESLVKNVHLLTHNQNILSEGIANPKFRLSLPPTLNSAPRINLAS